MTRVYLSFDLAKRSRVSRRSDKRSKSEPFSQSSFDHGEQCRLAHDSRRRRAGKPFALRPADYIQPDLCTIFVDGQHATLADLAANHPNGFYVFVKPRARNRYSTVDVAMLRTYLTLTRRQLVHLKTLKGQRRDWDAALDEHVQAERDLLEAIEQAEQDCRVMIKRLKK
jgi:hypothetical protein